MEPVDYINVTTHIHRDGSVYFGDQKLPGLIAEQGVVVKAGAPQGMNTLTVTFIVGHVITEDPTVDESETN